MSRKVKKLKSVASIFEGLSPSARADVQGAGIYSSIRGRISFFTTPQGVVVVWEVSGLPYTPGQCNQRIFGMHIHEGGSCTGTPTDPFAGTKAHYNPGRCPHPHHAGDLPPLFGNRSYAWGAVLTDRFTLDRVIGRTIVIHALRDDFTTDPSGNSGEKIACGVIMSETY